MEFIKSVFGGKNPWESMTAWGLVIFTVGFAFVDNVCANPEDPTPLLYPATCESLRQGFQLVGGILTTLGIRKAASTVPTVSPSTPPVA